MVEAFIYSSVEKEDSFLRTMNDINVAVHVFISQFQSHHSVSIHAWKLEQESTIQAGSYFCSGVVRLSFSYDQADKRRLISSVILKIPRLAALENYCRQMLLFEKERYVYERLLPLMYESWTREKLTPEFHGSTESGILVMENLQESNYYVQERGTSLNVSGCMVVLKSLAQFHALSVKHVDTVENELAPLTIVDRDEAEWAGKIYPPILKKIEESIIRPRCSARVLQKFDEYVRNMGSIINSGYSDRVDGGFRVVLHGDPHYHNVLFKDDRKFNVTQCKLIDFQSCHVGSPAIDIMMFLVTSIDYEVFEKNYETLFLGYLREFHSTLNELQPGCSRPYGLSELLDDVEKYKLFFLYFFTSDVPCFWAGEVYPGSLEVEKNSIDTVLKSAKFISLCEGWLKYFL